MDKFELKSEFNPTGDQPKAIKELIEGLENGRKFQVLLGATGTGKTFTISNVINAINKPTLVLVHNKTLAGQLYAEFKEFFPNNRVEYFVSNFDFYQPEAYLPSRDLYIDKEAVMNDEIEMLRASAINAILERRDTIIVASVAAIYALNDPDEYRSLIFCFQVNQKINRKEVFKKLVDSQYQRNDIDLALGTFRAKGDVIEIAPPDNKDHIIRIELFDDEIERISEVDPLTGRVTRNFKIYNIFPAYSHASTYQRVLDACETIKEELKERLEYFKNENKLLEHQRLSERTLHDLEALKEFGMCPGIENYSRHIDKRKPGEHPYSLFDYFPEDFLIVVDESHVSLPQIRGMYNGDRARKTNLVDYGFRLPSALDNRPLKFEEFEERINQIIFTSATPGPYELEHANNIKVEQIIRPTGLLDPVVEIKPTLNQIDDILYQINERIKVNERVLITTLTIRMAEDLTEYLRKKGLKVAYLHSETKTLERTQIIYQLRKGEYDILVGINLLREGIDLPEVSLILILDADKEGFLRSETSLIQIIGRAARNSNGKVIMYADRITGSMERAINETLRRRAIQEEYNKENNIIPTTIIKSIKLPLGFAEESGSKKKLTSNEKLNKLSKEALIAKLEKEMKEASRLLDFERAVELRDYIFELKGEK